MNTTIIGKNIKDLRDERGITQQQLADVLGVSFQTVSKWECNTTSPDISILPDIADYFEVTIDSLFTANANPYRNKAERLADKYGHDVEKSDIFFQAENEFQKMFTTENHDRTDLKNYAYLNACRMKYYLNKAEKNYLDVIAAGEKVKDELYYRTLTAYTLFLAKLGRAHERIVLHKEMLRVEPENAFNHITLIFAYIVTGKQNSPLWGCGHFLGPIIQPSPDCSYTPLDSSLPVTFLFAFHYTSSNTRLEYL